MGFGTARPPAKATMLVGVLAPTADVSAARGADILILDGLKGIPAAADISRAREANGQAALGLRAANVDRAALAELRSAGLDFLLCDAATPASALLEEELGFVLALPSQPEEILLRSLEPLTLDALYIEEAPSPLTIAGQIELMRIGVLGRRPLMAKVTPNADQSELECLQAAGVAVLVLEDASGVERLKEAVLALPPRRARRDDRPTVAVPRGPAQPSEDDDDDDT
jgi:hypothetical protein